MIKGEVVSRKPSNREGVTEVQTCIGFVIAYTLCGTSALVEGVDKHRKRDTKVFDTEQDAIAEMHSLYNDLKEVHVRPYIHWHWEGLHPVDKKLAAARREALRS